MWFYVRINNCKENNASFMCRAFNVQMKPDLTCNITRFM